MYSVRFRLPRGFIKFTQAIRTAFGKSIKMDRTERGWETTLDMRDSMLNFCFYDGAMNWDNNNGQNWVCRSEFGRQL